MSIDRRGFLRAGLALAAGGRRLWAREDRGTTDPLRPRPPMFPARARSIIFLVHQGALSQVDSFDPKPELDRHHGKKLSAEILRGVGEVKTFFGGDTAPLMKSPFRFRKCGERGMPVSEIFPRLGTRVDDLTFVHSLWNDINNHAPAMFQLNTGQTVPGWPSIGAWVTYALGTENPDLPGFVVMTEKDSLTLGGPANWGSGFLPAAYQGTLLRSGSAPILDLKPPADLPSAAQGASLELLRKMNADHRADRPGDSELDARAAAYERAFRMQARAPEVFDLSRESRETRDLYGVGRKETDDLGRKCLLARRLVERGVRFIQIYSGSYKCGDAWDAHGGLAANHQKTAEACDRPFAGLLEDLKRTGLLDQTVVVCASEFGRMPISQGGDGRDHNPGVQTAWMCGAGVKPGHSVGASDEIGLKAAAEPFHFRDLHATMLHLLGLEDLRLTYYFNGRHQRLTENGGTVIRSALA
ncbi:MAG TPA: DUF1501 domain-containing protein [Planctomycetota bacterium]|nr:DUF1501 domain-containing protein [Planctomycetota bacterium]